MLKGLQEAFISHFPIPAENKWQEMVHALSTLIQAYLQEVDRTKPASRFSERVFGKALYSTGNRWLIGLPQAESKSMTPKEHLEVVGRLFRILDIDSSVVLTSKGIVIVNYRCPYLEHAEAHGIAASRVCEIFCGNHTSFMRGLADSFPFPTEYQAGAMMGKGYDACTKHIRRLPSPDSPLPKHNSC